MNAILLNGALPGDPGLDPIQQALVDGLLETGWTVKTHLLHTIHLQSCKGCQGCWFQTPGLCGTQDDGRRITEESLQADLLIYLTPLSFGGYSSVLKRFVDRQTCLVTPFFTTADGKVSYRPRYDRYPSLLGVGVLPAPDPEAEEIFRTLIDRNALQRHQPPHAAGVVYRHQDPLEVKTALFELLSSLEVTA